MGRRDGGGREQRDRPDCASMYSRTEAARRACGFIRSGDMSSSECSIVETRSRAFVARRDPLGPLSASRFSARWAMNGPTMRGEAAVGGHPHGRKLRDAVRRQGQCVPGKHHHHEPGVALEGKRVGAAGVIDGEIARVQDCLAVVLDEEPGALQLEVELEIALVGLRNQRRRAVDLMARGGDLDECHTVQPAGPHATAGSCPHPRSRRPGERRTPRRGAASGRRILPCWFGRPVRRDRARGGLQLRS